MATMQSLVSEYGANAMVLADAGNGCGFGEQGCAVDWTDDMAAQYGAVEMLPLASAHVSEDGHTCTFASDWLVEGDGDNAYRVWLYF